MKNMDRRNFSEMTFSLLVGSLLTVALIVSINILSHYRANKIQHRPMLIVDLMSWPVAEKQQQAKPTPKSQPIAKKTPAPKKIAPAKTPKIIAEPLPSEKVVAQPEKLLESSPLEKTPDLVTLKSDDNSLPTPVPFFRLTHGPRFLHRQKPVYPEIMRADGINGVVKLEALIDKQGHVRQVKIIKSAGPHFDTAARNAILASSFYPAKIDNEPVAVLLRLPVKFRLL